MQFNASTEFYMIKIISFVGCLAIQFACRLSIQFCVEHLISLNDLNWCELKWCSRERERENRLRSFLLSLSRIVFVLCGFLYRQNEMVWAQRLKSRKEWWKMRQTSKSSGKWSYNNSEINFLFVIDSDGDDDGVEMLAQILFAYTTNSQWIARPKSVKLLE